MRAVSSLSVNPVGFTKGEEKIIRGYLALALQTISVARKAEHFRRSLVRACKLTREEE